MEQGSVFYNQQSIKAIVYVVGMNLIALAESGQIVRMEHWSVRSA